jgi:hypothetical protein
MFFFLGILALFSIFYIPIISCLSCLIDLLAIFIHNFIIYTRDGIGTILAEYLQLLLSTHTNKC